jgi:hypothetical protein
MKKFFSLVLSAALLCALGAPAGAAVSADTRLTSLTEKVKTTLGLDTSRYDKFHGELEENLVTPVWQLQWSGTAGELNITATEEGKILSYYRYQSDGNEDSILPTNPRKGLGASIPKLSRVDAQKTAQAFVNKVLSPGVESAKFQEEDRSSLSVSSYSFYGKVLEHGLTSPFSFYISVGVGDNAVTSFSIQGEPQKYLGGLPSPTPGADKVKAGTDLKSTQELYLEYVLDNDGKAAVLRYLPGYGSEYYVDAQTGKLVDLTGLGQKLENERSGFGDSANPQAAPDEKTLTATEMEGISKLEGVLSSEALDAAARKITALGLGKYALANTGYHLTGEGDEVIATLQYAYKAADGIYRRVVSLNAKTGVLSGVYSSRPWSENEKTGITSAQSQVKAEAFLKNQVPAQFAKTALYTRTGRAVSTGEVVRSFQYAQQQNGYFFPASSLSVEIDGTDGSVSHYSNSFMQDVTFQDSTGIVSMDAARSAWFDTYTVTLCYLAVPEKLDLGEPKWKPLIEMGQSYLYTQKLAYYLQREGWYLGIDAKTGAPVGDKQPSNSTVTYNDLSGHWVRAQAMTLAEYGVGWLGGSLLPAKELTQRDVLALLVSTSGYYYDGSEDSAEQLYQWAYGMGLIKKADRNDHAAVSRAALTKLLLDSAGYGNIAGLEGIFKVGFADQAGISAQYYGYAAVAQALGVAKGDKAGNFAPLRTATRAEAVSMLYQLMSK